VAAEIIPIELGLTAGNGVTLWAPRWQEDGEEWEAFLGHGDDLYVLPSPAHLAAFIRTNTEHDLADHPEWEAAAALLVDELRPDEDHSFDIVGVPDLVAEPPDIWTLAELSDTVAILRSLAEVCGLDAIDDVLGSADGFAVLPLGEQAFTGRAGEKLWNELGAVVVDRWDEVLDAIDGIVTAPDVDPDSLTAAQSEADAIAAAERAATGAPPDEAEEPRDEDLAYWDDTGIDCLEITVGERTGWTLRCYLGDNPVFLSSNRRIWIFESPAALEDYVAGPATDHRLAELTIWEEVQTAIREGQAAVLAGPENTYVLDGLAEQLAEGPAAVDAGRLDLAAELLIDAAKERGDEETVEALGSASPLGNLVGAITRPNEERLAPSPPFADEAAAWSVLVDRFAASLEWHEASK
jgi:hypothetical protein